MEVDLQLEGRTAASASAGSHHYFSRPSSRSHSRVNSLDGGGQSSMMDSGQPSPQSGNSRIRLSSSVLAVNTLIKTEARRSPESAVNSPPPVGGSMTATTCPTAASVRSRNNRLTGGSPSMPSSPVTASTMHPISLSLLQQQQNQFYSSSSNMASPGGSASVPSPLKRSRDDQLQQQTTTNWSSTASAAGSLPSPGQMSVDSMSPPPPPPHPSGGQHQQPGSVISSSNGGYSPSPMSTGSFDGQGPYSPATGLSKLGREDLSPAGSVGGYGSVESFGGASGSGGAVDGKKTKKGPVPRQQEELCLVCGDRASGYHYNALTCEGCKGFFRRSITKNAVYQCKYGNGCDIDMYMRRKCQECRLKKCLTVGMRPECVVPEYQCAVKREAKKAQKEKERPGSSSLGSPATEMMMMKEASPSETSSSSIPSGSATSTTGGHHHNNKVNSAIQQQQQYQQVHIQQEEKPVAMVVSPGNHHGAGHLHHPHLHGMHLNNNNNNGLLGVVKPLSPEQEELINRLVYFQEEFDQPSEEDLRKISTSGMHESDSEAKFKHITEMTILTVQLTVEFSKRLPGFDTLLREDQITLLKACSSEVMMLRCARRYDAHTDSIVFANNLPYTRDSYNMAGVGDTAEPLFRFGKTMSNMKVDNAEYALLTAIVIFSERPGLVEARKVEKIQEIYLEALQAYVMNHRTRPMTEFAKLLSVLTELRTLGNLNSEMCFSLKLKNKKLPPFLAEIWDVHS